MAPELEKPRITEIQVRIDCNGCVQKIKKALHCISGIYEIYIDLPKQKITVIGWADPEKIIKAIKKTRRTATLCSHSELPEQYSQPSGPLPEGEAPPPPPPEDGSAPPPPPPPQDAGNPPPTEGPQPQPEPPNDQPPPEPPKDQQPLPPPPPPETMPPPTGPEASSSQPPPHPSGPRDVGEVHVIDQHPAHHSSRQYPANYHPPDYHPPPDYYPPDVYSYRYGYSHRYDPAYTQGYGGYGPAYSHPSPNYRHEQPHQQPVHVSYNYNTYRPSPYVTQYEYVRSPPRYTSSTPYAPMGDQYHYAYGDHYRYGYNDNGNAASVFSDENPNACTVV